MFTFETAAPSPLLASYVSMFYRFETMVPQFGDHERADIAHCRFSFGRSGSIRFGNGQIESLTGDYIIGPRNRASFVTGEGPGQVFGFGILPLGWMALTGVSASEHTDRVIPAATLLGTLAAHLRDSVNGLNTIADMARAAEAVLVDYVRGLRNEQLAFIRAVDDWQAGTLSPDFDALVQMTGLSRNKTETLLKDLFGASPSLFIRKAKALRVANRIAHGEGDWQDFIDGAYYDQSHCIREIKYFTGLTPAALRSAITPLTGIQYVRRRNAPSAAHDAIV